MPSRPYWKGYMRLSLVTVPVGLYAAIESSAKVSFHQIQRSTGQRIREVKVVPGQGEVSPGDIAKGVEVEKGQYVLLDDQDFEKVKVKATRTIDLDRFFRASDLDPLFIDKGYYLAPDGTAAGKGFALVREALRAGGRAALGRVVLSGRERLVAVVPRDREMVLYTLHTADMVRAPGACFGEIETVAVDPDEVAMAETLVERRMGAFDPGRFVDRYQEGLRRIIDAKRAGQAPPTVENEEELPAVGDVMEALHQSLAAEDSRRPDARQP